MAEIICKVGPGSGYEDGDILCAFNDLFIQRKHAEHICHPWKATPNEHGLLATGTVVQDWYEKTHQFRFERVSDTEVKKVVLSDLSETIETRDVKTYMLRRKGQTAPNGAPKKAIFGTPGAEVWYGGRKDFSQTKIDAVWNDIETKTPERKTDYPRFPLSETELRHFVALPVDDFTDSVAADLIAPEIDDTDPENPITVHKRKRFVNWPGLFPIEIPPVTTEADVRNRAKLVDARLRPSTFNRANIVSNR